MPFLRTRPTALRLAVTACLLALVAALYVRTGTTADLLPESSWGAWKREQIADWSVFVRVDKWVDASEADIHMGKAEDITLKAYGHSATGTTVMDNTTFTLTPDGKVTGKQAATHGTTP